MCVVHVVILHSLVASWSMATHTTRLLIFLLKPHTWDMCILKYHLINGAIICLKLPTKGCKLVKEYPASIITEHLLTNMMSIQCQVNIVLWMV